MNNAQSNTLFPLFEYLHTLDPLPALVAYNPTNYDPRDVQQAPAPPSTSIREDLTVLRTVFDGLILYAYHDKITPTILEKAVWLSYRTVILGIWDTRSKNELDEILRLVSQYRHQIILAVCIGNEGLTFSRYTLSDLTVAIQTLRPQWTKESSIHSHLHQ